MYAAHNPAVKAAVAWYGPVARSYHPGDKSALDVAGRIKAAGAGACMVQPMAGIPKRHGREDA
jgi:dienelactone hydrolase